MAGADAERDPAILVYGYNVTAHRERERGQWLRSVKLGYALDSASGFDDAGGRKRRGVLRMIAHRVASGSSQYGASSERAAVMRAP